MKASILTLNAIGQEGDDFMLRREFFTCCKCGKPFYKSLGGIIATKEDIMFRIHPICDECKAKNVVSIVKKNDTFKK